VIGDYLAGQKTKIVDKWKAKQWYSVKAPQNMDLKEIAEVVASDPKLLPNRVVRRSLMDLGMADPSQISMFTTLRFRITDVRGNDAHTILLGHEVAPSFIKTFARRGKSLINQIVDGKTKDGMDIRLKLIAVTGARVSMNTKKNLRSALIAETNDFIAETGFDDVMNDSIHGKYAVRLFNRLKQITKMRRVEVRMSERLEVFK